MPTWKEQLVPIRRLREERTRRDADLYRLRLELHKARGRLEKLNRGEILPDECAREQRPARRDQAAAERIVRELTSAVDTAKGNLDSVRRGLHDAIVGLFPTPHPQDVVAQLGDDVPFLLLPVRIETRFMTDRDPPELWLRVYPDDIAVHTHEKTLTDREVERGEMYWRELWHLGARDAEEAKKKAWTRLADEFGGQRAAWVAHETKPTNWNVQPRTGDPAFPPHDLTKTSSWSRAPRTQVLPDRLVVLLYEGDAPVIEEVGALIPDELVVGPDPLDADGSFVTAGGKLVFGGPFAWAADIDEAVKIGMGFKIRISPQQAVNGFDKMVVLGVSLSMDETDGQSALEALIDNHHYSPKGFAIIRQGTPTNNTEDAPSGFTKSDPFHVTSYYADAGEPLFTEKDDTDGRRLADALGIGYAPLQFVANADATDGQEAVAMNTALYPGTLGYYFGTLLDPVLPENARDELREFFLRHVSGRGPIPAIRVGNQPYGILLTSDFAKWEWSREDEPGLSLPFLAGLHAAVKGYHAVWLDRLARIAHVGRPGEQADPSAVLLDILGLQAGSVTFHQRTGYSTDYLKNRDAFQFGGRYFEDMRNTFTSKNALLTYFESLGYRSRDANGNLQVPQLLRLVFQHSSTELDAANLVDGVRLSEKDTIRNYDEALKRNYIHWLAQAQAIDVLERQDFGAGHAAPNALLYLMLRRALLLQLHAASVRWLAHRDVDLTPTLAATNIYNIRPEPTLTKWEAMRTRIEVAVPHHPSRDRPISDYLLTIGRDEEEAAFLTRVKAALKSLADLPTARLERLLTEHIDTCTYRLDSWQTGMFDVRLRRQRAGAGAEPETQRKSGIYLGAFGWVENLRPSARVAVSREEVPAKLLPAAGEALYEERGSGGFIHAPSLNHASAAAVLRSGYLTHANSAHPDAMAVNVSSDRVRRALFVLQGIRNGQTLEALLGYQFERALHDAASADDDQIRLNEYVHELRAAFPIEQHYIGQQGATEPVEAIPATNVVNGVRLAEATGDVPYGATGGVATASDKEKATIRKEKERLVETLDAVKDLLLAESVYQMVQGNVDRAGAVTMAMQDTHIPPEIDVINTPRSSRFTFTNRVAVQFGDLDPHDAASNPWPAIPMTPRARVEPGLNRWLGQLLGEPSSLLCRVAHLDANGAEAGHGLVSVDKLALQPVDLVYIVGSELNTGSRQEGNENRTAASELEVRIAWYYRGAKGLPDATPIRIEFLEPAGMRTLGKYLVLLRTLKSIITDSRPLHALDFDPPSKKSPADVANREGYDLPELPPRIQRAVGAAQTLWSAMKVIPIDAVVKDEKGNDQHHLTLGAAFDTLTAAKLSFSDIPVTFTDAHAELVQSTMLSLATLGVPDAFPRARSVVGQVSKIALLDHAMLAWQHTGRMIARANDGLASAALETTVAGKVRALVSAGKAILGDAFNILPRFRYHDEADVQLSHAGRAQLLAHAVNALGMPHPAEEWLQNVSHVRARSARFDSILGFHEAFTGTRLPLLPIQLPYRASDSWLAVEFPEHDPLHPDQPFAIEHDTLAVTIHGDAAFVSGATQAGLLVDDWTEVIPTRDEISGITFNYNQPNAAPPQALLLAVTPKEKGHWRWQDLLGIVNDTLLRSKLRAVDPQLLDGVNRPEVGVLLPAVLADFSALDVNLALDFRMFTKFMAETAPILPVSART